MRAKSFFYVCAGLLCLAISYDLGAQAAGAQGNRQVSGFAVAEHVGDPDDRELYVLTMNGDVYMATFKTLHMPVASERVGNFWKGGKPIGTR